MKGKALGISSQLNPSSLFEQRALAEVAQMMWFELVWIASASALWHN